MNAFQERALLAARYERGDLPSIILRPCRIRILMVVDGYGPDRFISFNRSTFGLRSVLDTLRTNPEYFVRFEVTRAHRQMDHLKPSPDAAEYDLYAPHFENFHFDQSGFDISKFDEVWLFGIRTEFDRDMKLNPDPGRLSPPELAILARWMDAGGGVFATGDHATLGASLCAQVPRVGTMRKWTTAQSVPPQFMLERVDTLSAGHDAFIDFDDESDDVPMRIIPRLYSGGPGFPPWAYGFEPHPVLCGRRGVIDVLPDHPHEGEIIDEGAINLGAQVSFDSYNAAEYPTVGGVQPTPEVIAWADVLPRLNVTDRNKQEVRPRRFPVLGAYDGHPAGVGRILVDSTWHHWFDGNLTGRIADLDSLSYEGPLDDIAFIDIPEFPDAIIDFLHPKRRGFLATPEGRATYARIQNYFRNVAMWTAPEGDYLCMFVKAMWGAVLRYPLVEQISPDAPIWEIGVPVQAAMRRSSSPCFVKDGVKLLYASIAESIQGAAGTDSADEVGISPPFELFETYVLGGAARRMLSVAYEHGESSEPPDEQTVVAAFTRGAHEGVAEFAASLDASIRRTSQVADAARSVELPDPEALSRRIRKAPEAADA